MLSHVGRDLNQGLTVLEALRNLEAMAGQAILHIIHWS